MREHYFSVHPSVCPASVHLSVTLSFPKPQWHWAEFNQTCYINSPYGKGVREQHIFLRASFRRPSICPSCYLLNHWTEFNKTCYMTSHHGRVFERNSFFPCVCSCVRRPSITLSHHKPQWNWAELNQTLLHEFPLW